MVFFGLGKTFKASRRRLRIVGYGIDEFNGIFSNVSFILKKLEHVKVKFHAIEVLVERHGLVFQGSEPFNNGILRLNLRSSESDALFDLRDICRERSTVHSILDFYFGGVYALVIIFDNIVEKLLVTYGFHFVAPGVVFKKVQASKLQQ